MLTITTTLFTRSLIDKLTARDAHGNLLQLAFEVDVAPGTLHLDDALEALASVGDTVGVDAGEAKATAVRCDGTRLEFATTRLALGVRALTGERGALTASAVRCADG